MFNLKSKFVPTGDQPEAIKKLSDRILNGEKDQILLGVTGSGKTFTIANVIKETGRPALIMAPNKTLAAQLYGEYKKFFPDMQAPLPREAPLAPPYSFAPRLPDGVPQ